jgi:hypothetical protein
VQRCVGEVLAVEADVKKDERCFLGGAGWCLVGAWVLPAWEIIPGGGRCGRRLRRRQGRGGGFPG